MKNLSFLLTLLSIACNKDESIIYNTNIITVKNDPPIAQVKIYNTAEFNKPLSLTYPYETVVIQSESWDPENFIRKQGFIKNSGDTIWEKKIEVSYETPGSYNLEHIVIDDIGQIGLKKIQIKVSNYPNIIVRLSYIEFAYNNGDGGGKPADIYMVYNALAPAGNMSTFRSIGNRVQQLIYPGRPDSTTPLKIYPYEKKYFGSGVIIYQGRVDKYWGFSGLIIDHDRAGFNYLSLVKNILTLTSPILEAFVPGSGVVTEVLAKATGIVEQYIKKPEDDIVARFNELFTAKYRWGLISGPYNQTYDNGITLHFDVELF